ncbi:MAG: family 2 glycosyl transferase [Rhodocyclaceae bacterium]|nr:MAG: family 2 glycosyl transferase [Rhodocyclaceae bacterium]TNC98421.1 MAG: family 2 glycosyl transferase [Rhodocyclaceae bacterium]
MLISIGIMAWNEAGVIETTLTSLFGQSALRGPGGDLADATWEVIVVPNGCSDDTAACARRALERLVAATGRKDISWTVHELVEAGKSNAWNHYVHELASPDAEMMVMIDADIEFGEAETLSNSVAALRADPHALVAVDLPLKDAVRKPRKTLLERFSLAASKASAGGTPAIAGSFYCARAATLRQIWMPKGLSIEDGFLRAMIVTDCFRAPIDERRIIRAPNASHYFETLTSLRAIFRHEVRLVIGNALNCYLTWDLLHFATDPEGPGAGVLIRNRIARDARWYPALIENAIRNHGWWVLPRGMLFRRFSGHRRNRDLGTLRWLALATAGFLFDLPVFLAANRKLKRGNVIGYW